jgi:enterochelin esterase-like enzyme
MRVITTIAAAICACALSAQIVHCGELRSIPAFPSSYVEPRQVDIWIPPDYEGNGSARRVLIMQDGQNLFDRSFAFGAQEWQVDETLCRLAGEGFGKLPVVVGVWNTAERRKTYYPSQVFESLDRSSREAILPGQSFIAFGDEYAAFIAEELLPWLRNEFNVSTATEDVYLGGSSMGALISCYTWCRYPEQIGGVLMFSTHWIGNFRYEYDPVIAESMTNWFCAHIPDPESHSVWMDRGTEGLDSLYAHPQDVIDRCIISQGFSIEQVHLSVAAGETHNEYSWSRRFPLAIRWMLRE